MVSGAERPTEQRIKKSDGIFLVDDRGKDTLPCHVVIPSFLNIGKCLQMCFETLVSKPFLMDGLDILDKANFALDHFPKFSLVIIQKDLRSFLFLFAFVKHGFEFGWVGIDIGDG